MSATAPQRPPAPASPQSRDARPAHDRRHRRSYRRTRAVGLLVSVLAHALLFLIASRTTLVPRYGDAPAPQSRAGDTRAVQEMHAYNIVTVEDEAAPIRTEVLPDDEPEPRASVPRVQEPPQPSSSPAQGVGTTGAEPTPRSPADRLRPRLGDPRLWTTPEPPPPPEKTDLERARERVYSRLGEINDSLALEADAARRATDWTFKDGNGGRWGISPGKVHLGDLTLPLPIGLTPRPDVQERDRRGEEIKKQGQKEAARENFDKRAEEIRKRKEKERSQGGDGKTDKQSNGGD